MLLSNLSFFFALWLLDACFRFRSSLTAELIIEYIVGASILALLAMIVFVASVSLEVVLLTKVAATAAEANSFWVVLL